MIKKGENFTLPDIDVPKTIKPFRFLWVAPGDFTLGWVENPRNTYNYYELEYAKLNISLTQGFWMGQYVVSQGHWKAFRDMETNAKRFHYDQLEKSRTNSNIPICEIMENDNLPMGWCNWLEAVEFCKLLNIKFKKELPKGYHFSLPTEAQWEYTCRAGQSHEYNLPTDFNYHHINSLNKLKEIGTVPVNPWGFHDMLGCIRQMCFDIALRFHEEELDMLKTLYPYKDENNFIDWFPNDLEKYSLTSDDYLRRVTKAGGISSIHREIAYSKMIFYKDGFPPMGFRIALRPITKYDFNDPLLKQEGINILGDDEV